MKKILVVIDMLNDFIDPNGKLYCGPTALKIIKPIKKLVNEYHKNKDRVVFLCDNHDPDDKEFERFPVHAEAGSWGQAIIPGLLEINKDKIFAKKRYSGFYNTNLDKWLLLNGFLPSITEVTVVGVCTSICIYDTTGGFANRDYTITVPENCVADFNQKAHEFFLKHMYTLYGVNTQSRT